MAEVVKINGYDIKDASAVHSVSMQPTVVIGISVSGGTLSITTGTQSYSTSSEDDNSNQAS